MLGGGGGCPFCRSWKMFKWNLEYNLEMFNKNLKINNTSLSIKLKFEKIVKYLTLINSLKFKPIPCVYKRSFKM